jgi:hypothetical protein
MADMQYYTQRLESMRKNRGNWEAQWEESAQQVIPEHWGSFLSRSTHNINGSAGQKKTQKAYDSTPILANQRFSAVMESLVTPQNSMWARLVPADKRLEENREVLKFFEEVNELLFSYRYRPIANFVGNMQQTYMGLGAYGNGVVFIDQPENDVGTRYRNIHLGEVFFEQNHARVIDTAYRSFRLTVKQLADQFGEDALPESVKGKLANPQQMDEELEVLHAVEPNKEYSHFRLDSGGMAFTSIYLLVSEKHELQRGGYNAFPYAIARYTQAPNEIYGRGPAQMVLPSIKVLNEEKKTVLKQGQRIVDPVLLAHDDGTLGSFSLKSGALNAGGLSKDGKRLIDVLPTGNLAVGEDMMNAEKTIINDAFLLTLFQILVDSPQMTATEVLERAREKGMLVAPTAGRLQSGFVGAIIARELGLLAIQGVLPIAPPLLRGGRIQYKIEYNSPMSRMMEAEKAAGVNRSLAETIEYVQVTGDTVPLDWFNFDAATPAKQRIHGSPVDWTRSQEDVAARREQRAQAQQQQQAVEAAPAMAGMMKAVPQENAQDQQAVAQ